MLTALDAFFIIMAGLILTIGFSRRLSRLGEKNNLQEGDWSGLLAYLFRHRSIFKRRWVGWAHLILVWGFAVFLFVVILDQVDVLLLGIQPMIVSLLLDIVGSLMLASTFFLLGRRCFKVIQSLDEPTPQKTLFPLVLLLMIIISGFLAEGLRLAIESPSFEWTAPVGSLFSFFLIDSPLLLQLMIRLHFYLFLLFIAVLPFTFMRHITSGLISILNRMPNTEYMAPELVSESDLAKAEQVEEFQWQHWLGIEACVSCGRCQESCPATLSGKLLRPANLMQEIHGLLEPFDSNASPLLKLEAMISPEIIWSCNQCQACIEHCPVYSRPMDIISAIRRHHVLSRGMLPSEARPIIRNLELFGDTSGKGAAHRLNWSMEENIPIVKTGNQTEKPLLWLGCSGSFHPEYARTMRSLVEIFKKTDLEFEVLGEKELCCGEPARRLGEEMLFRDLALRNIEALNHASVTSIVTGCPHCYQTLKNEYPRLGGEFQVRHSTEVIWDLIQQQRITYRPSIVERQVAIHDPCYLGRGNHLYKPIRSICESLPGITISELPRNRENGFCCGGGGGRMWLPESGSQPVNRMRSEEIITAGVDVTATACPYCKIMLDDGIGGFEADTSPQIRDVIDLVANSL